MPTPTLNYDCWSVVIQSLDGQFGTLFNLLLVDRTIFSIAAKVLYRDPFSCERDSRSPGDAKDPLYHMPFVGVKNQHHLAQLISISSGFDQVSPVLPRLSSKPADDRTELKELREQLTKRPLMANYFQWVQYLPQTNFVYLEFAAHSHLQQQQQQLLTGPPRIGGSTSPSPFVRQQVRNNQVAAYLRVLAAHVRIHGLKIWNLSLDVAAVRMMLEGVVEEEEAEVQEGKVGTSSLRMASIVDHSNNVCLINYLPNLRYLDLSAVDSSTSTAPRLFRPRETVTDETLTLFRRFVMAHQRQFPGKLQGIKLDLSGENGQYYLDLMELLQRPTMVKFTVRGSDPAPIQRLPWLTVEQVRFEVTGDARIRRVDNQALATYLQQCRHLKKLSANRCPPNLLTWAVQERQQQQQQQSNTQYGQGLRPLVKLEQLTGFGPRQIFTDAVDAFRDTLERLEYNSEIGGSGSTGNIRTLQSPTPCSWDWDLPKLVSFVSYDQLLDMGCLSTHCPRLGHFHYTLNQRTWEMLHQPEWSLPSRVWSLAMYTYASDRFKLSSLKDLKHLGSFVVDWTTRQLNARPILTDFILGGTAAATPVSLAQAKINEEAEVEPVTISMTVETGWYFEFLTHVDLKGDFAVHYQGILRVAPQIQFLGLNAIPGPRRVNFLKTELWRDLEVRPRLRNLCLVGWKIRDGQGYRDLTTFFEDVQEKLPNLKTFWFSQVSLSNDDDVDFDEYDDDENNNNNIGHENDFMNGEDIRELRPWQSINPRERWADKQQLGCQRRLAKNFPQVSGMANVVKAAMEKKGMDTVQVNLDPESLKCMLELLETQDGLEKVERVEREPTADVRSRIPMWVNPVVGTADGNGKDHNESSVGNKVPVVKCVLLANHERWKLP